MAGRGGSRHRDSYYEGSLNTVNITYILLKINIECLKYLQIKLVIESCHEGEQEQQMTVSIFDYFNICIVTTVCWIGRAESDKFLVCFFF